MPSSHLSQINPTRIIKRRFELDFMKLESLVKQQKSLYTTKKYFKLKRP